MAIFFFFLLSLASLVADFYHSLDLVFISRLLRIDWKESVPIVAREYHVVWGGAYKVVCLSVMLFGSWALACLRNENEKNFSRLRGLTVYIFSTLGICSLYLYYFRNTHLALSNQSFWAGVGRFGGVFSDPNALGLVSALCLIMTSDQMWNEYSAHPKTPPTFHSSKIFLHFHWLLVVEWLWLGMLSGSRSFFLIVLLTVFLYAWSTSTFSKVMACTVTSFIGFLLLALILPDSGILHGFHRSMQTVQLSSMQPQLESRIVFFQVNLDIFAHHPFFGVGFNRFFSFFQQTAMALGFATGAWKDGPNSYYLSILSELGLCGGVLFILAVTSVIWKKIGSPGTAGTYAFFIALLFGNHSDFLEVALLASCIIATTIDGVRPTTTKKSVFMATVAMLFISHLFVSQTPNFGTFEDASGAIFVRRDGQLEVKCGKKYSVDAPWLSPDKAPLHVTVSGQPPAVLRRSTDAVEVSTQPCENRADPLLLRIGCSRFYYPPDTPKRPYCVRVK